LRVSGLAAWIPLAERLVFRQPAEKLRLSMRVSRTLPRAGRANGTEQRVFAPANSVTLTVKATDEAGQPIPNILLGITVVDNSALQLIEPRKQAPRLPTMVLLEDEVGFAMIAAWQLP
jgi:hypothetical protein